MGRRYARPLWRRIECSRRTARTASACALSASGNHYACLPLYCWGMFVSSRHCCAHLSQATDVHCGPTHTLVTVSVRVPAPLPPPPAPTTDSYLHATSEHSCAADAGTGSLDEGELDAPVVDTPATAALTGVPTLASLCESRLCESDAGALNERVVHLLSYLH